MLQLTLAIIKPHITSHPVWLRQIRDSILKSNFKIVRSKQKTITTSEAENFYYEHKDKFFYNRLVTFMTSGPCQILILAKEDAIAEWRSLMGPTKVFRAQFDAPESIRGKYGLSDTRNATHGSDSLESCRREISVFFDDFNYDGWMRDEKTRLELIV